MLLFHLAAGIVFFATAIFGLTSESRGSDFWAPTTFEEIQATLLFNDLSLSCFLALGALQVILSIIFFKTKILQQHQLSRAAKTLALLSGILLITKTVVDYPLIKEAIFVASYMLKISFPNNILSIVAPVVYLFAQISVATMLFRSQKSLSSK